MKAHKNTITFNGRLYDAATGKVIHAATPTKPVTRKITVSEPRVIAPATSKPSEPVATPITVKKDVTRSAGQRATTIHVKTERPKTLMRKSVKKPVSTSTKHPATGLVAQPEPVIIHGSITDRQERAAHTLQNKHISKFVRQSAPVVHKTAEIPVKSAPIASRPKKQTSYNIKDTPPTLNHFISPVHHAKRNVFEEALASATTHQAPRQPRKKAHSHRQHLAAGLTSIVLLASFFTYLNIPRLALSRASSQIGFGAHIPGYRPAGFTQNSRIQYQKGLVIINFHSNSDDRTYTITQTTSGNQSSDLGRTYLEKQGKPYEQTAIKGQQVYLYGGANATWIKDGVWYTIEGGTGLNKDQLTKIVASI